MKFAFELRQRIILPNSGGTTQGVIVSALAQVGSENQYSISAVMADGKHALVGYGENELLAAQPVPAAVKAMR